MRLPKHRMCRRQWPKQLPGTHGEGLCVGCTLRAASPYNTAVDLPTILLCISPTVLARNPSSEAHRQLDQIHSDILSSLLSSGQ